MQQDPTVANPHFPRLEFSGLEALKLCNEDLQLRSGQEIAHVFLGLSNPPTVYYQGRQRRGLLLTFL